MIVRDKRLRCSIWHKSYECAVTLTTLFWPPRATRQGDRPILEGLILKKRLGKPTGQALGTWWRDTSSDYEGGHVRQTLRLEAVFIALCRE
jgi:hypothetical protein